MKYSYPVKLTPDKVDGGFVVTCRDLPEAITQGETLAEALEQAEGALQAAIEFRLKQREAIPAPTMPKRGESLAMVPISTAMKAALHIAMRDTKTNASQLAARMGVDEKAARRILDPHYPSKVPAMERALQVLGRRAEISIV
jgi:antitoxin HicB